jgi:predicted Zn-dependent protease
MQISTLYASLVRRGRTTQTTIFAWLSITILLAGCGLNLFSLDEDVKLGQQTDQEIRSNPSQYPILQNESVRSYVQGVVNRIIQSPDIKYRGKFPYTVTILNDDKTVNAFATPGGYIYVYTGLLKFIGNEATLAGILGHEIGHSELRHGTQQMTEQVGADVILSIALGNNPTALAQVAANAASLLSSLANSRSDENEADAQSVLYLRSTSWYPGAIKSFFEKIQTQGATPGGTTPEWLSTHPSDEHRLQHIDDLLAKYNIPQQSTTASLAAAPYQSMLRNLH